MIHAERYTINSARATYLKCVFDMTEKSATGYPKHKTDDFLHYKLQTFATLDATPIFLFVVGGRTDHVAPAVKPRLGTV